MLKTKLAKIFGLWVLGFILFFTFRIFSPEKSNSQDYFAFNSLVSSRKNIYNEKIYGDKKQTKSVDNIQESVSKNENKFEKTANLASKTSEFTQDEKKIRETIKSFEAIIQAEENKGNKGTRHLQMSVGVKPQSFDSIVAVFHKIGHSTSLHITKIDKTSEYKSLNAKRASLEKIRNSLLELKSKGGVIQEFISLENRILEIENELQNLGVELGNFSEENEFCTVKISLAENFHHQVSVLHRIRVAFEWTIRLYTYASFMILLGLGLSYGLLLVIEKLLEIKNKLKKNE